jgi:hypothetical protein
MNIKKIVVLISSLLLLTTCTMAQYGGGSDNLSQPDKSLIIVEGCLGQTYGNFDLTDPSGASYQLTGKTEKLSGHIGQTIRVTATSTPVVHVPGSMSEGTETQPTLTVISFRRLSGVCTNGANNIP